MITCLYGKVFINRIKITHDGEMYSLKLYLNDNNWCPLTISLQTIDQEKFLNYIKSELSKRKLFEIDFAKVELRSEDNLDINHTVVINNPDTQPDLDPDILYLPECSTVDQQIVSFINCKENDVLEIGN